MLKKSSIEFVKFCAVGLIATLVNYGIFYLVLDFFAVNYLVSSAIGFIAGLVVGYPINKYWTFSSKKDSNSHILPYLSVYLFSLILSLIFLRLVVEYVGIIPEIANILAIGLTTCTNFIGTKFFVFKTK